MHIYGQDRCATVVWDAETEQLLIFAQMHMYEVGLHTMRAGCMQMNQLDGAGCPKYTHVVSSVLRLQRWESNEDKTFLLADSCQVL